MGASSADTEAKGLTRAEQRGRASYVVGQNARISWVKVDSSLKTALAKRPKQINIKKPLFHYLYCWQV